MHFTDQFRIPQFIDNQSPFKFIKEKQIENNNLLAMKYLSNKKTIIKLHFCWSE